MKLIKTTIIKTLHLVSVIKINVFIYTFLHNSYFVTFNLPVIVLSKTNIKNMFYIYFKNCLG